MFKKDFAQQLFIERKAIKEGHFLLTSGLHSKTYIQCAHLLEDPSLTQEMAKEIINVFKDEQIEVVFSPAIGGIIWGYALALELNCRHVFAERVEGKMTLRRGYKLRPGQRVLLAEDVITTGGSVIELKKICQNIGANVIGLAAIVDRSNSIDLKVKTESLLKMNVETYRSENCPLCKQNIPIEKPGSRT